MPDHVSHRRRALDELGRALAGEALDGCAELVFRILYSLPPHIQIGIAQAMMERYLPAFRARQSVAAQLEPCLVDPADWVVRHGRAIPDLDAPNPADSAFHFCFDALLLAASHPGDAFTVTSAAATAVDHAVLAARLDAWMIDDPAAVDLWYQHMAPPERTFVGNEAARAAGLREWAAAWALLDSPLVLAEPEPAEADVDAALARWIGLEFLISVPR